MSEDANVVTPPRAGWRIKLGAAMLALSVVGPLVFLPLFTAMELPGAAVATLSGGILVGAEVLGIAAIGVMGKSGYAYIKSRVFGLLRRYGPPQEVGRTRYVIGLVMFSISLLFGWLAPYARSMIPGYEANIIAYALLGDSILLVSVFVLGGEFWEKLRALFVHGAKAVFPDTPDAAPASSS